MKKSQFYLCLLLLFFVFSCSSRKVKLTNRETKTAFGITIIAPSQAAFFVENTKIYAPESLLETHTKIADSIYNNYGPATENRFLGRTDAKQLKFILEDKTYLIEISDLNKRTAMILFDGKNKPTIVYKPSNYKEYFLKFFYYNKIK